MRAVVLVGGLGTRLRPLTDTRPKQMLPIGGRPMIERVAHSLASHGITEIVLSLGYRPDAFEAAYPEQCAGVPLRFAIEPELLGTAGAIRFAARTAGIDETFVVLNGDVLTDLDLGAMVAGHRATGALATIALQPVADPSRFGVVVTDDGGRVLTFVEKPPVGAAPSNQINAGTYVMEPEVVDLIPEGRPMSVEREIFPMLVESGRLRAHAADVYWIDCGTPAAFLTANADLFAGRFDDLAEAPVRGTVAADAAVTGSWIAAGAVVEAGATVRSSVLMERVVVGRGASVIDSIIGEGARIGAGAFVRGQSVVGDGVVVSPGSVLDGARVPEPVG